MTEATGIVLAAGAGRRLGGPKADVVLGGVRLLDRAVETLLAGGCRSVIAVVRDGVEPPRVAASELGVVTVINPDPDRGLGSSLRLALAAAADGEGDRAVTLLVDRPGITADSVRRALAAPGDVVIADYAGVRAHPVVIARRHWAEVGRLAVDDSGARAFLGAHPEWVTAVSCVGDPSDLDTPADLAYWRARLEPTVG